MAVPHEYSKIYFAFKIYIKRKHVLNNENKILFFSNDLGVGTG
jgi:hypothetical protein